MRKGKRGPKRPSVCLAIPTFDREGLLVTSLRRALALRPRPDEVLLIDQTPSYGPVTSAFLRRASRGGLLRRVYQEVPNVALARGRAVAETRCDVVIFMDDDALPPKDLVRLHLRNYSDPSVDAVAARIQEPNKGLYPHKGEDLRWPRLLDPVYFSFDSVKRAEGIAALWGTNFSARTRMLRDIGPFDGNYVGAARFEDADIAVRIWERGGKIVYDPGVLVRHRAAGTGGTRVAVAGRPLSEWRISFSTSYFAFRYYWPSLFFWYMTLWDGIVRHVFRPRPPGGFWRVPWALTAYVYAWLRAGWAARVRGWGGRNAGALRELRRFSWTLVGRRLRAFRGTSPPSGGGHG